MVELVETVHFKFGVFVNFTGLVLVQVYFTKIMEFICLKITLFEQQNVSHKNQCSRHLPTKHLKPWCHKNSKLSNCQKKERESFGLPKNESRKFFQHFRLKFWLYVMYKTYISEMCIASLHLLLLT
jgi:hypothetical protein